MPEPPPLGKNHEPSYREPRRRAASEGGPPSLAKGDEPHPDPASSSGSSRATPRHGGPIIVPRAEHSISRRQIDPDALKVLHRLQQFNYAGYLVGGSVRDLLLGRAPKDFDVGTDAHPYQIKKLFRNCWIIGRRFRLAHVRFGSKTIEVATFRRGVPAGTENDPSEATEPEERGDLMTRHDNTFGTPEEDASRRDFTINALFYDIATFSIIDYVGGLDDLRQGIIRSIGDPNQRFQEDPVRMFRAVAFAARLGFRLDPPVVAAIHAHRRLIATASPARLIEEYYKVLRSGAAEQTFRLLAEHGLLEPITPELHHSAGEDALWEALAELDRFRQRFDSVPESLTNAILLGTLLVPLGLMPRRRVAAEGDDSGPIGNAEIAQTSEPIEIAETTGITSSRRGANDWPRAPRGRRRFAKPIKEPPMRIGLLPVARRDTERLRQILAVQRRLMELDASPRAKRALMQRSPFQEAMVWLEIHGRAPEALEHWRGFIEASDTPAAREGSSNAEYADLTQLPARRRRRRRRGRRRGGVNRKERE